MRLCEAPRPSLEKAGINQLTLLWSVRIIGWFPQRRHNCTSPGLRVGPNPALLCFPDHKTPLLSPVVFCMRFVLGEENNDKIPVALGIKEKGLYLSCTMKDKKPTLQLEVSEYQWPKHLLSSSVAPVTHYWLPRQSPSLPPENLGAGLLDILQKYKYT